MKPLGIRIVVIILLGAGGLWVLYSRQLQQQQCVANMDRLYSAAVSYCLEHNLKPDSVLGLDKLTPFLRPSDLECPDGHKPYPPFSVLQGPTCPYGHQFAPGAPRPLRAPSANSDLASLYRSAGLTNLVAGEAGPGGAANRSQPVRSETNGT